MSDWPVILKVRNRRVVVVGGGGTAARRAASLAQAGADVVVIAPELSDAFDQATANRVTIENRKYKSGDLDGAFVVVIATNDRQVNEMVHREAIDRGVLVNRADDPNLGDVSVPAHHHVGPITVAVHTNGISAAAGAKIRDELLGSLDDDWITLLQTAAPFRQATQSDIADPAKRQSVLKHLTDEQAMRVFKEHGAEALKKHYQVIIESVAP